MPIKSIEKTIDGHDIKIVQFNGVRGFKLKTRLFKLLLPVFGEITPLLSEFAKLPSANLTGVGGPAEQSKINQGLEILSTLNLDEVLPRALVRLSEQLDEEVFFKLIMDLLQTTFIDGRCVDETIFNEIFIANYLLVYKLIIEVIKANHFFVIGELGKNFHSLATTKTQQEA